ncbi:MAG: hypothetical protein J7530_06190 [Novosphingobium sp.]|nr:hypothetical protein [Novosphingobium sp.]
MERAVGRCLSCSYRTVTAASDHGGTGGEGRYGVVYPLINKSHVVIRIREQLEAQRPIEALRFGGDAPTETGP